MEVKSCGNRFAVLAADNDGVSLINDDGIFESELKNLERIKRGLDDSKKAMNKIGRESACVLNDVRRMSIMIQDLKRDLDEEINDISMESVSFRSSTAHLQDQDENEDVFQDYDDQEPIHPEEEPVEDGKLEAVRAKGQEREDEAALLDLRPDDEAENGWKVACYQKTRHGKNGPTTGGQQARGKAHT